MRQYIVESYIAQFGEKIPHTGVISAPTAAIAAKMVARTAPSPVRVVGYIQDGRTHYFPHA
jgi:hypothetical protein